MAPTYFSSHDNKMYRNKFRKLIREGHLNDLLELTEIGKDPFKLFCWLCWKLPT